MVSSQISHQVDGRVSFSNFFQQSASFLAPPMLLSHMCACGCAHTYTHLSHLVIYGLQTDQAFYLHVLFSLILSLSIIHPL